MTMSADNLNISDPIYTNPLGSESDIEGFIMEGQCCTSFPKGALRLENALDPSLGQASNFLFWCPQVFPANLCIRWDFMPLREPGLAMLWFAATGKEGKDLFDPSLAKREGNYRQYHSGDINGYHISYFRRKQTDERLFHTCNMRKSHGFHLVCQGADPIPSVPDIEEPFRMEVIHFEGCVRLAINDLPIFTWQDDGHSYGPRLSGGRIGFRQMSPLIAEYANLTVHAVEKA